MTPRGPRRRGRWLGPAIAAWAWLVPLAAISLLGVALAAGAGLLLVLLCAAALAGVVIVSVHHAEVVAHRVGEPFGTLVLAVAVTVIEAALILSMVIAGGSGAAELPRDTIYAALMIILNGVVGACLLVGGLRHGVQTFRVEGANSGLAALFAMATLSLVLPIFTSTTPSGTYSDSQLTFAAVASIALWAVFVFVQTIRHRDYFLPEHDPDNPEIHADPPSNLEAWLSFGLLLVSLVAVIGLAKVLSPTIERAVLAARAPQTVIGIAIALLVLMPETWAAVRAARITRLQTSMNLAVGSALASIGLTIPVVAIASVPRASPSCSACPRTSGAGARPSSLSAITPAPGAPTCGLHRERCRPACIFAGRASFHALVPEAAGRPRGRTGPLRDRAECADSRRIRTNRTGGVSMNTPRGSPGAGPPWSSPRPVPDPAAHPAPAQPVSGGDFTFGYSSSFVDILDPHVTSQSVSHFIMLNIFDPLVSLRADGQVFPGLAESWTVHAGRAGRGRSSSGPASSSTTARRSTPRPSSSASTAWSIPRPSPGRPASPSEGSMTGPRWSTRPPCGSC